jgi:hypothetical protein
VGLAGAMVGVLPHNDHPHPVEGARRGPREDLVGGREHRSLGRLLAFQKLHQLIVVRERKIGF